MAIPYQNWLLNNPLYCYDHHNNNINNDTNLERRVHYADSCKVILVPSKEEYIHAGIELWCGQKERHNAINEVGSEIRKITEVAPSLPVLSAMALLYQPEISHAYMLRELENMDIQENLFVLLACSDNSLISDLADTVYNSLNQIHHWTTYFSVEKSLDNLVKTISKPYKKNCQSFGVIIIDSSILQRSESQKTKKDGHNIRNEVEVLAKVLLLIRAACDRSTLIGLNISESSCNSHQLRTEAFKHGIDFVWTSPICDMAPLLPLLLAARKKAKNPISITELSNSFHG